MTRIYGIEVSESTVSRITDKVLPAAKEWQQKPLESIYAVMFMNAIHYHVRSEGQIMKKAVYIAIGIDLDGRKDVLEICGWVRTKAPNTGHIDLDGRKDVLEIGPLSRKSTK